MPSHAAVSRDKMDRDKMDRVKAQALTGWGTARSPPDTTAGLRSSPWAQTLGKRG